MFIMFYIYQARVAVDKQFVHFIRNENFNLCKLVYNNVALICVFSMFRTFQSQENSNARISIYLVTKIFVTGNIHVIK